MRGPNSSRSRSSEGTVVDAGHRQPGDEPFAAPQAVDVAALRRLLSLSLRGELTAGLPHGFGRIYEGPDSMMVDGRGAIGGPFDMRPEVERAHGDGDVLIPRGHHIRTAGPNDGGVRAAFARFWGHDGERLAGVYQVKDGAGWEHAPS